MYKLPSNPAAIPHAKSIFQYPAYFDLLAENTHFNIHFLQSELFFFSFSELVIRYIGPDKTRMHRAHLRCGPYNNVFFVACLPHCAGTDPLSASPLSFTEVPLPFWKKKIHWSALFHFPVPALRQLLLIWKSKESTALN